MSKFLTLKLLGQATISLDDRPLTDIGSRTAEALFIFLACEQRPFTRQYLAEFFWEERDPEQSAANLRAALSMLRKQVGDYLLVTRQTVAFNRVLPYQLDVAEFADAAHRPSSHPSSVVALYGGDFLDGFYVRESRAFEEWSLVKREQLQHQAVLLLRQLLADPAVAQNVGTALAYANHLLRLSPFSEYAHQQKMLLLARSGQLSAALKQYQACQNLLQEEIGVTPNQETTALAKRIQRAGQTPRHNLPPAPTPFVGRERELAELHQQLVDPQARLLTIFGPGGVGKTRLALEAARRLIPTGHFLSGLRFVSLAEANGPDLIPHLIAVELDLTLQGDGPPADQLAGALAGEEMLLILDNLEHLLEGEMGDETAGFLAQLLTAAPLITFLVTSRRRLQLQEEWLFDVAGLSLPAGDEPLAADAVRLFLQTAVRVQRQFQPTADDLSAIVRLCHALEGLPLGIELAAAWLHQLSCLEIVQELEKSIALLTTSLRNVPPRQRSITAVFDYSWAHLPETARLTLAQLALFRGGFTAVAAKAVAGATTADLTLLVDHSLLRVSDGRSDSRYSLHELLRQYAVEQLAQNGIATAVAQHHAAYFLDYLSQQGDGEEMGQRQAIRAELANIRAAWETAVVQGDEAALLPAAATLHNFYSVESRFHEGIALLAMTMDDRRWTTTTHRPFSSLLRADLLGRIARMQIHIGQVKTASRTLDMALEALQQVDDPARQATIFGYVAITAFYAGDFTRATNLAQESLALSEQLNDQEGVALALSFLGSCHKSQGDYTAAADSFTRAVAVYEQRSDDLGKAMALNNLGNLAQAQGDFTAAQEYYLTCSRLFQEQDHLHGAATTLANAGRLAGKMGDFPRAESLLQESLAMKREQQDDRGTAVALLGLAEAAQATGENVTAHAYLQEGIALAQQAGDVKLTLEGVALAGALAFRVGNDPALAAGLLAFVLRHPALTQEVREQVEPLQAEIEAGVWDTAVAWASRQTLAEVYSIATAQVTVPSTAAPSGSARPIQ